MVNASAAAGAPTTEYLAMLIQLNFINRSYDPRNAKIVIFQKNEASGLDEPPVAWQVIEHRDVSYNQQFRFPTSMTVGASDSWGNHTPQIPAENGSMYHVELTGSGDTLSRCGPATSSREVQVRNDLARGTINASIYREGRLLAIRTNIAPGQKAVFEFRPNIWIGAAPQVTEGDLLDPAILSEINTELSLVGIVSADIVMTGGGPGPDAEPFTFHLENILMA